MTQILKRLEIIKSSLAIEDEEIIELQIAKLNKLEIDDDIKAILQRLENQNYDGVLKDIESYLHRYTGVVEYVDTQTQELKLTLKILEKKLQILCEQKSEYLSDIEEFNRQYSLKLGDIIENILNLKKEILYKQTLKKQKQKERYQEDKQTFEETKTTTEELRNTISELEEALENIDENHESYEEINQAYQELQDELRNLEEELEKQEQKLNDAKEELEEDEILEEYEEAEKTYEEYHQEYAQIKEENSVTLSEDEKKELKILYKKAARLCHPDIVIDTLKEKAHEIMQALNDAYSKKDIAKVKEISYSLENGTSFKISSDAIEDKEVLKSKVKEYESIIQDLEAEIEEIKGDEIFVTISELDDWDEYFEEIKSKLEKEQQALEDEARGSLVSNQKIEKAEDKEEDEFIAPDNSKAESENKNDTLKIELTNSKYLNYSDEKETRDLLFDGAITNPKLSVEHEPSNSYDSLAVKVHCNGTFIGYVLKYKNKQYIEQFCFENEKLKKMIVRFVDREIVLSTMNTIEKEKSSYADHIKSIENIKFEKIRKYCENLSKSNEADEMQKYLGARGKVYKALMYDALEQFIEKLDSNTITMIDWGCEQGIASMLVLDYIKEKQLDIKTDQILLLDNDNKNLSRAMAQVKALDFNGAKIEAFNSDDNDSLDILKTIRNNTTLNLFANDKMPIGYIEIVFGLLKNSYFMCVSNQNKEFVDEVYENIKSFIDSQDLSIRDGKIGRFDKFERIFRVKA